jgi:predicted Rossmann fold nucleotide-binding protein DprA/Smf involved in DNA uptake
MSTLDNSSLVHHNGTSADDIAERLSSYAALVTDESKDGYSIHLKDPFHDLPSTKQVAVALFLQRVKSELTTESPWLTPSELTKRTGLSMAEVYPALRQLERGSVVENQNGLYRIPGSEFSKLKSVIRE